MHTHSVEAWTHEHVFLGEEHDRHERRTWAVVALAGATMLAEIGGGTLFGSMALVADGWHMSTHAAALGIAALAYRFARRHRRAKRGAPAASRRDRLRGGDPDRRGGPAGEPRQRSAPARRARPPSRTP